MKQIYSLVLLLLLANVTCKATLLIGDAVQQKGHPIPFSNDDIDQAVKSDIKVKITKGEVSSFQKGMEIEKAFDGDLKTLYHSSHKNKESNYFPIDLTFNFENEDVDYLIYHPRSGGGNGAFKDVEIYATTTGNSTLTKVGTKALGGSGTATKVEFKTPLKGVTSITIKVLSGAGARQGFASCAEMEFFKYNPDNFDPLTLFSDKSCIKLKNGVTIKDIKRCKNAFFQKIALAMFENKYPSEFRIGSYKAWMDPKIQSKELKTARYSLLDNPTGIVVVKGSPLIVLVGETNGYSLSIKIQDLLNVGYSGDNYYPLVEGVNKIVPRDSGLIYVMYHSEKPEDKKPINVHFATGDVNGYFDSQKHKSEEWSRLLNAATYVHFDVVGEYAHLTFPTSVFKEVTPDGKALIDFYDRLVKEEQIFMGLEKYNKMFKNRSYLNVAYKGPIMFAAGYRTAYNIKTMPKICDLENIKAYPWGPAHEIGHINQTRPGLNWIGMAEVTTNIHSMYIQRIFGNKSRLESPDKKGTTIYKKAHLQIEKANTENRKLPFSEMESVFCQLVPFWQLYLYCVEAEGKADFYKDLYEYVRVNPNPETHGECQLEFVRLACISSGFDLTDFFEYWGFLTPIDITVESYGTADLKITQEQIDKLKTDIASKGYKQPKKEIWNIVDSNVDTYK